MKSIHAVYENGVFRPTERPDLPDGSEVEFEPRLLSPRTPEDHRARILHLLSQRIETGEPDMAERHDEPLP